jgi:hypothetical protein
LIDKNIKVIKVKIYSTKFYSGDLIKTNEMSRARSRYGAEKRCIQRSGGETWGKQATLKPQAEMGG